VWLKRFCNCSIFCVYGMENGVDSTTEENFSIFFQSECVSFSHRRHEQTVNFAPTKSPVFNWEYRLPPTCNNARKKWLSFIVCVVDQFF